MSKIFQYLLQVLYSKICNIKELVQVLRSLSLNKEMRSLEDTCETVTRKISERKNCFLEIMTEFKNILDCFDDFRKSNRVLLLGIANGDKIENLVEVRRNYSVL